LKTRGELHTEAVKEFLQDIVGGRATYNTRIKKSLFNRKQPPDMWVFDTKRVALKYLECKSVHNSWMTKFLIKEMFDCQMAALSFQVSRGVYPNYHLRYSLEEPYNRIVPPLVGLAYLAALLVLIYYLLDREEILPAAIIGAYLVYHYVLKIWQLIVRWGVRRKLIPALVDFRVFHHEVSISKSYDVDTIIRRLTALEEKGVFPFSLTFALLKLRKSEIATQQHSTTNTMEA
jgi:hypothetical protein